jgi:hypothetical protein
LDRRDEVFDEGEVGVADEHGDYLERVGAEPGYDGFELGLEGAGVEEVAGGVAVVEGFVDVVDLALDWEVLVGRGGRWQGDWVTYACVHHRSADR